MNVVRYPMESPHDQPAPNQLFAAQQVSGTI